MAYDFVSEHGGRASLRMIVGIRPKAWLLIALGVLGSVVAWALLGRNVNNVCRCDTSGHKVSFVTVEPGVQLEILDWAAQVRLWFCSLGWETTHTCSMSLPTS
jgi:hypothetical protein